VDLIVGGKPHREELSVNFKAQEFASIFPVACPWRTKKELQETLAHFVLLWQLLAFIF
jgi:hypothetical protein